MTAPFFRTVHINSLNAELNPIFHLLALLGAHHIFHISRIKVKLHHITMLGSNVHEHAYEEIKSCNITVKTQLHLCPEPAACFGYI
jgi:hypothetical protein